MKKLFAAIAGIIFGAFGIGVLGLLISLTYSALGRIFPDNFENQMWGLVLFDIATIAWFLAFVFQSHSLAQYAAAGVGFLTGLVGTIGMVAAEVTLSSGTLTGKTDTSQIGQWMVYAFIAATIIHVILIYAHHGGSPEISQKINTGIARGEIVDQAMKDAVKQLDVEKAALAQDITEDILSQVKRDLQLTPIRNTIFDRRQTKTQPLPYPIDDATKSMYAPGTQFTDGTSNPPQAETKEAGDQPNPFLKSPTE